MLTSGTHTRSQNTIGILYFKKSFKYNLKQQLSINNYFLTSPLPQIFLTLSLVTMFLTKFSFNSIRRILTTIQNCAIVKKGVTKLFGFVTPLKSQNINKNGMNANITQFILCFFSFSISGYCCRESRSAWRRPRSLDAASRGVASQA